MPIYTPGSSPIVCNGHRLSAVWQTTANGPIIRRKTDNRQFRQLLSTESRARMLTAVGAWRQLTALQQSNWDTAATSFTYFDSCGNSYTLSGQQLFNKSAKRLLDRNAAINPATPSPVALPTPTVVASNTIIGIGLIRIDISPDPVPAGSIVKVYASRPVSQGQQSVSPSSVYLLRTFTAGTTGLTPITPEFTAIFQFWQSTANTKTFIRLIIEDVSHGLSEVEGGRFISIT